MIEGVDPKDGEVACDVGAAARATPCARITWCVELAEHDGPCVERNRPAPVRVRIDLAGYFPAPRKDP